MDDRKKNENEMKMKMKKKLSLLGERLGRKNES